MAAHDAEPKADIDEHHAAEGVNSGPKPSVFDDPECYPGLTLAQPYAGAVLLAAQRLPGKTIETRKVRFTRVGAEIVVCAGLDRWSSDVGRLYRELVTSDRVPIEQYDTAIMHEGAALCLVTVVECRPLTAADYSRSLWWDAEENARKPRWAWVFEKLRPIKPFAWRGSLGFSRVPRKLVEVIGV